MQGFVQDIEANIFGIESRNPFDIKKRATEAAIGSILGAGGAALHHTVQTLDERAKAEAADAAAKEEPAPAPPDSKYDPEKKSEFKSFVELPTNSKTEPDAPVGQKASAVSPQQTIPEAEILAVSNPLMDQLLRAQKRLELASESENPDSIAEAQSELKAAEKELLERTGDFGGIATYTRANDLVKDGTHAWVPGYGLKKKDPVEPPSEPHVTSSQQIPTKSETSEPNVTTQGMEADLLAIGKTKAEIDSMTLAQVENFLNGPLPPHP